MGMGEFTYPVLEVSQVSNPWSAYRLIHWVYALIPDVKRKGRVRRAPGPG